MGQQHGLRCSCGSCGGFAAATAPGCPAGVAPPGRSGPRWGVRHWQLPSTQAPSSRRQASSFEPPWDSHGEWHTFPPPPGSGHSSPGLGGMPPSHGPGPGLPIAPTGTTAPLQRPDRLGPALMADPVNIAADHEGDPRDVLHRLILQSATGAPNLSPWYSDSSEALLQQQQQQQQPPGSSSPLPSSPEQLRQLSGPDLSAVALAILPTLPPSKVAQLSVALARLEHFDMQYKAALVEHVVGRMYQFTPQQLADVAWAVAACGYYDLPFLEALAGRLRDTAPQWDARSLAKVLWAFGRFHFVGRDPPVGADALEAMVEKLQSEMDGSTVAEVIFAAGKLCGGGAGDWQEGRLQALVSDFARENIRAFGPEALGKLASGLNELSSSGVEEEVVEEVARRAAELANRLEPEDICRVMELLEAHGRRNTAYLEALAARAVELMAPPARRLAPHQAGALVAGFNALGHVSESVLTLASRSHSAMSPPGGFVG